MNNDASKHILTQVAAVISGTGALASWIQTADIWLRIIASLIAIVVGILAIIDWHNKRRKIRFD